MLLRPFLAGQRSTIIRLDDADSPFPFQCTSRTISTSVRVMDLRRIELPRQKEKHRVIQAQSEDCLAVTRVKHVKMGICSVM